MKDMTHLDLIKYASKPVLGYEALSPLEALSNAVSNNLYLSMLRQSRASGFEGQDAISRVIGNVQYKLMDQLSSLNEFGNSRASLYSNSAQRYQPIN